MMSVLAEKLKRLAVATGDQGLPDAVDLNAATGGNN
jgi:hypothetical protein